MQLLAGLGPLGVPELLIIALLVVLVFGVGRLPEVGGAVGKSIREFRKATKDDETAAHDNSSAAATPPPASSWSSSEAPAGPSAADAVFCGECGAQNIRGAKFCSQCGHTIAAPVV